MMRQVLYHSVTVASQTELYTLKLNKNYGKPFLSLEDEKEKSFKVKATLQNRFLGSGHSILNALNAIQKGQGAENVKRIKRERMKERMRQRKREERDRESQSEWDKMTKIESQ